MNRLGGETSPYLLQHKDNPVDWWPWATKHSRRRAAGTCRSCCRVGYAACHWCHVMAHESFEDDATAGVMNDAFVNIKVDREERPDVDAVYMELRPGHDRARRLADDDLPDPGRRAVLLRAPTSHRPHGTACRPSASSSTAITETWTERRARRRRPRRASRRRWPRADGVTGGRGRRRRRISPRPCGGWRAASTASTAGSGRAQVPAVDGPRVAAAAPRPHG